MSWVDESEVSHENMYVPRTHTPIQNEEILRRLLNAEVTVNNLKRTVLKLCTELEEVRSELRSLNTCPSLDKTLQPQLEQFYDEKIKPEMFKELSSMKTQITALEQLQEKSPFDITVLT